MTAAARKPGHVAIRCDVPIEVRDKLRVLAAQAGLPMTEYVRRLLAADAADHKQNR